MKGIGTNLFELLSNQRLTRLVMPLPSLVYTLLYVGAPMLPPIRAGNIPFIHLEGGHRPDRTPVFVSVLLEQAASPAHHDHGDPDIHQSVICRLGR